VAEKHSDDRHTMGASHEGLCSQAQKLGSYRCCYNWSRLTSQFQNMCTASKPLQLGAAITRDPEAAQRNSRVSYRLFCFRSSRGHTFQTRLTGSASVRQFDSADRRTTFRGFARLLKPPKSLNFISVSAARACRQCCCPAPSSPARR